MVKFSQVIYFVLLIEGKKKGNNFHCESKFHVGICNTNTKCRGGLHLMSTAYSSTFYIGSGLCVVLFGVKLFIFLARSLCVCIPMCRIMGRKNG